MIRCGSVGYRTQQGLGHLLLWFHRHGIIQDILLVDHPRHPPQKDWYPPETPIVNPKDISGPAVDDFLSRIDILLGFETFFDWNLIERCRQRGIKTVLMPMIEWSPKQWPIKPDALICPSLLDYDEFRGEFPADHCKFLPVPAPPLKWQLRTRALRFLHNAGHVGHREHKGTRQLLEALRLVKSPVDLTVRCQYDGILEQMVESTLGGSILSATTHKDHSLAVRKYVLPGNGFLHIESRSVPYESLFDGFDVYVAPEKLNGLSLPLQEAHAAGLLVMTTDRYPANTWLLENGLIPVAEYRKARISTNYREFYEAVVEPETIAEMIDHWYGRDIARESEAGRIWAGANSWDVLKPQYLSFFEGVCTHY